MLTRVWTSAVQPEWKLTVTRTAADAGEPAPLDAASDEALVAGCLSGRRDAFDRRAIYYLCYRFVGNHEDASDLAQDVFIRAYRGLARFKREASLATWLYRIGVNVCLNRVGARRPTQAPLDEIDRLPTDLESPAEALLRGERAAEVRQAIARLPKKQRATLVLRVYHELPHDQIAGVLGSSVGAVKANFFHALKNLKKLLQDR
jgi:RNA polymerase sigma-70 factor (ECF subfamily)